MAVSLKLVAEQRSGQGTGAARRLRIQGRVPAVVYGGKDSEPSLININHGDILHSLENEAFYSSILNLEIDGQPQKVVLKDIQRHPAKPKILHADFLRVRQDSEITMSVPVHYLNAEACAGIKAGGDMDAHYSELEIRCMAKDLPESIDVDLTALEIGESINLSELSLPEGVNLSVFIGMDKEEIAAHNQPLVQINAARAEEVEEEDVTPPGEVGVIGETDATEDDGKESE